ncbi:helix-turn-helix domain-containing protein [Flavobacterium sp. GCM10023249]|uniref:helix-turn-helix domain-containing protein n=1 Tax=unclassified Flavobacterium TaxID=196869 RepID=UPI0036D40547
MRQSIFCAFLLITSLVFSQNRKMLTDKQFLELQDKTKRFINSNVDSAFVFANRIEQSQNATHKVFALAAKSYLYQLKRDSIQSKKYYAEANNLLIQIPNGQERLKSQAFLLNCGGLSEWKRLNFGKALSLFLEGKKISKKAGDLIQVVKFNNNIALINSEVGNFKLAIKASREMDAFTDEIEYLYAHDQFIRSKSNINLNLGTFYEKYYANNKSQKKLLDSAEYYYKKTLNYSNNLLVTKINAKLNLGNVYFLKRDMPRAKKNYEEVLFLTKEDGNLVEEYYTTLYNLGNLCFTQNKYDESLVYFLKMDSIYKLNKIEKEQSINSNYYLAKIYNSYGNASKARAYSKAYIESYENNELKLNDETSEVNVKLNHEEVKKEMFAIQKKYKNDLMLRYFFTGLLIVLIAMFFYFKSKRDRKKVNAKVNAIIEKYKLDQLNINSTEVKDTFEELTDSQEKKEGVSINLDEEKENEILEKLIVLEKKLYYLKPDFTQQSVAKKIKTNTTYLSYVVNKKFGKSFSEYSNELKINYAINEMISNPVYRKYSTQAIAESVGFKNAVSFTRSFNKRTGVTPAQFIKRLESNLV